jgi:hypothetical protein
MLPLRYVPGYHDAMRRSLILVSVALAATASLTGCSGSTSSSYAERIIIGIGDDITPAYPTPLDAEILAAWALENPRVPPGEAEYDIEVLDWSGNSGDPEGARVDFRIGVHLLPRNGSTIGDPGQHEERATRCWSLTIFGLHDYDSLRSREITCPGADAPARTPRTRASAQLPANSAELLTEALGGATSDDLADRVRAAFPDTRQSVETAQHESELIAAVGDAVTQSCRVAVRHVDGTVEVLDEISLANPVDAPLSCAPTLYIWSLPR